MKLLLSSGGVNGIAHFGVLEHVRKSFDEFHGVSIGALFAMLLSAGYILEEIRELVLTARLEDFFVLDPMRVLSVLTSNTGLGLDTGALLREKLRDLLFKKGKRTFDDLPTLNVYAVNLRTRKLVKFCKENPCDPVDALMASMCLPPLFEPVPINGDLYVDGAVIDGFPQQILEKDDLGIYLRKKGYNSMLSYLFYILDIRETEKEEQLLEMPNVIIVDCVGSPLEDLGKVRRDLIEAGNAAGKRWLKNK
jgi:NTE family protein